MPALTEEQEKDVLERRQKFLDGYEQLKKDTQMQMGAKPDFVPVGPGFFGVVVSAEPIDTKYANPSPIPGVQ